MTKYHDLVLLACTKVHKQEFDYLDVLAKLKSLRYPNGRKVKMAPNPNELAHLMPHYDFLERIPGDSKPSKYRLKDQVGTQ